MSLEFHRNGWAKVNGQTVRTLGPQTLANEHSPVKTVGGYPIHNKAPLDWPELQPELQTELQPEITDSPPVIEKAKRNHHELPREQRVIMLRNKFGGDDMDLATSSSLYSRINRLAILFRRRVRKEFTSF